MNNLFQITFSATIFKLNYLLDQIDKLFLICCYLALYALILYYMEPPSLSGLTPVIPYIELTHLGSEAFIY